MRVICVLLHGRESWEVRITKSVDLIGWALPPPPRQSQKQLDGFIVCVCRYTYILVHRPTRI